MYNIENDISISREETLQKMVDNLSVMITLTKPKLYITKLVDFLKCGICKPKD